MLITGVVIFEFVVKVLICTYQFVVPGIKFIVTPASNKSALDIGATLVFYFPKQITVVFPFFHAVLQSYYC